MAAAAPLAMDKLARRVVYVVGVVFQPVHLRRTGTIAAAVGTWLTLVNQGDVLLAHHWSPALFTKIALNYLTPFTVSNLGLLSRTFHRSPSDGTPHTGLKTDD